MFDYNNNIYVYLESYDDVVTVFEFILTKYHFSNWKNIIHNFSEKILMKIINILGGIRKGLIHNYEITTDVEFFYHDKKIMHKNAVYGYLLNYAGYYIKND